jgi:hypothetical protein
VLTAAALCLVIAACGSSSHSPPHKRTSKPSAPPLPTGPVSRVATIGAASNAPAIPSGFVGLSLEQNSLAYYTGTDPQSVNPVFLQLIRNLNPGQRPVLRLGGDSTDKSWLPIRGMAQPEWVKFTFTPSWLQEARALAGDLGARLIVGVNFEAADPQITAAEAGGLIDGLGRSTVDALELGNEPELYSGFNWYRNTAGVGIKGRGPTWSPAEYAQQTTAFARALPDVPLAGPAVGSTKWIDALGTILSRGPRLSVVTVHAYPLKKCSASTRVTIPELLARSSSVGLADGVAGAVRVAGTHGDPLRVGEMNSVSCGGETGVSNTFATSLWSLNTLFNLARVGVAGVNFHTSPRVTNHLFTFADAGGQWTGTVYPVYYGLLMFAHAAPPGSKLLDVSGHGGSAAQPIWAVRTAQGQLHVVLINERPSGTETVTLKTGTTAAGTVQRLSAATLGAESGVTIAGQGFGAVTSTGVPAGTLQSQPVSATGGGYRVAVPAHSAALLSIP